MATVRADPSRARVLAPWDGWVIAAEAALKIQTDLGASANSSATSDASRALRREPLAVNALAVLGTKAQLQGNPQRSRALFQHASQLSRRNLQVQLSIIQAAVDRGDIDGALYGYDIAFRTSSAAQSMLFPVLAAAVEEPKIRKNLIARFRADPSWEDDFFGYAVRNSTRPLDVVALLNEMQSQGQAASGPDRRELVNLLYRKGQPDAAWSLYNGAGGLAGCGSLHGSRFQSPVVSPSVFDWVVPEGSEAFARGAGEKAAGALTVDVPPSTRSTLLRQVARLCPGRYTLAGVSRNMTIPAASQLLWRVSCRDGETIAEVPVRAGREADVSYQGKLVVSSSCPMQIIDLIARTSDGMEGIAGELVSIVARRVTQ